MSGYTREEIEVLLAQSRPEGIYKFSHGMSSAVNGFIYRKWHNGTWHLGYNKSLIDRTSDFDFAVSMLEDSCAAPVSSGWVKGSLSCGKEFTFICDMDGQPPKLKSPCKQLQLL